MDEALKKLREEIIEKMFQMGYSLDGEYEGETIIRLGFYKNDSPAIFVEISNKD